MLKNETSGLFCFFLKILSLFTVWSDKGRYFHLKKILISFGFFKNVLEPIISYSSLVEISMVVHLKLEVASLNCASVFLHRPITRSPNWKKEERFGNEDR